MDVDWATAKLESFVAEVERQETSARYIDNDIQRMAPTILRIVAAAGIEFKPGVKYKDATYWSWLKRDALIALGVFDDYHELERALAPDAPVLAADSLHYWIWDAARPSWDSRLFRAAVHHAASSLNEHIQKKIGRTDIADTQLVNEAFSEKAPTTDGARLRIPGNQGHRTIASRQQGSRALAQGAFLAIRNPAAHETREWSEQEALESLAVLSVIARTVESCIVETI